MACSPRRLWRASSLSACRKHRSYLEGCCRTSSVSDLAHVSSGGAHSPGGFGCGGDRDHGSACSSGNCHQRGQQDRACVQELSRPNAEPCCRHGQGKQLIYCTEISPLAKKVQTSRARFPMLADVATIRQGGWATGDPEVSWGPGSLEETYYGENADAPGIPCESSCLRCLWAWKSCCLPMETASVT